MDFRSTDHDDSSEGGLSQPASSSSSRPVAVAVAVRRRARADSIPEDRETNTFLLTSSIVSVVNPNTRTTADSSVVTATASAAAAPSTVGAISSSPSTTPMGALLMRHSSPLILPSGRAATSPLTERNSSPSPLRLNRPRSNPRNRTPMLVRQEDHYDDDEEHVQDTIVLRTRVGVSVTVPTQQRQQEQQQSHEPRRIAQQDAIRRGSAQQPSNATTFIRPTAGMAVGTTLRGGGVSNRIYTLLACIYVYRYISFLLFPVLLEGVSTLFHQYLVWYKYCMNGIHSYSLSHPPTQSDELDAILLYSLIIPSRSLSLSLLYLLSPIIYQ
jgi:hypothetical protein